MSMVLYSQPILLLRRTVIFIIHASINIIWQVCLNAWYDQSRERVPEARTGDYFRVFHWTEKFIWEGKKDEMEIEEEKRIYMPITFSTTVQQHSSDAIYFPTLLSDDPITCTCQQKENLNAIRHDKGLANQ